jgi:type I restriction enzyme M protein
MFTVVDRNVFPFLRTLGGNGSTYAHHMKDARFTIPTPQLLAKVVDLIAEVPMEDRDTKGDLYEYMLAKIATAGQNGQSGRLATSSSSWSRWSHRLQPT